MILALVLVRALLSMAILPAGGAGLGDTEAYYTAWAMDPSWAYHDHPGAIAWCIAAARWVTGGLAATRLVPVVTMAASLWLLSRLWAHRSEATAGWGVILFGAIPIFGTGGLLAAPDAPLAVGWAAALLATDRALALRQWRWFVVAGLACAWMLASKWIGVILMAALVAETVWQHRGAWAGWARAALMVGVGSLGLLPTLIFEATHGLTGVRYHLLERHTGTAFALENWATFAGGQLVALSPILAVLLFVGVARRLDGAQGKPPSGLVTWRVAVWAWVPLASMCVFTREAEPHWPVMAYLPVLGEVGAWGASRTPRWLSVGVVLGVTLQGLVWLHVATPAFMPLVSDGYEPRYDLANDLRGWDAVAVEARGALDRGEVSAVVGYHYTVCGQLAAALDDLDAVVCTSRRRDAFDFLRDGASGRPVTGRDLLYVRDNRYDEPGPQRLRCRAWDEERFVEVGRGGRWVHRFGLRRCRGFMGLTDAP